MKTVRLSVSRQLVVGVGFTEETAVRSIGEPYLIEQSFRMEINETKQSDCDKAHLL